MLIVDGAASERARLATLLGHAGYEVGEASTGAEALALARERIPDAVIADALMPGMDGYELVRRLRADPDTATVLVIFTAAAYVVEEVRGLAEACAIRHVLAQPPDAALVLAAVEAMLAEGPPVRPVMPGEEVHRAYLMAVTEKLGERVQGFEASDRERRRLLASLLRVTQEERTTIAGDLHDDAVQAMAAAAMRLELLERRLPDPEVRTLLEPAVAGIRSGIDRLRGLVARLRAPALDAGGLAVALDLYLAKSSRDAGYTYDLTTTLVDEPADELGWLLCRTAEEALVNVAKRGGASHVTVELGQRDRGFWVRVGDDGARGTTVECWIPAGE